MNLDPDPTAPLLEEQTLRPIASARRVLAAATTAMLVHLPVLFLGGLAMLMRADLPAFDAARLGLAVSSFFAVPAIASMLGGRLAEARGPPVGMVAAGVGAAISLVGMALRPAPPPWCSPR